MPFKTDKQRKAFFANKGNVRTDISPRQLPTFKGYTRDDRLRQFRKVTFDKKGEPSIKFIDFDSPKGRRLLSSG
ncbi:hypothetical protein CMI37_37160 [Candidatus Pacearchaeota archaeon]|nr:hypothetical protein [Candidatus Pacearchaeota archaeon]|tara:strand:- start:89 stop:310 length:222 start_codon:yes stop_codon:yes gene_type:complete